MKLADWLDRNRVRRAEFARRIGVSPGAVTQICRDEGAWVSRETAERIVAETAGAVTPNDFLAIEPAPSRGNEMSTVNKAIEAFARGEIVAVTDDDDRENEGDLIVAASQCTPEKMAFIIRNCCGIVCAPLTADDARGRGADALGPHRGCRRPLQARQAAAGSRHLRARQRRRHRHGRP
jgi:3,4-dihydroxy 2-butanone 4-phosphate synthase/GTP cyclohydrolase II